jgi:hypothetical protein
MLATNSGAHHVLMAEGVAAVAEAGTVVTLEFHPPGYVDIGPGEEAIAPVAWSGWNGEVASGEVRVQWPGGQATVTVEGPRQPTTSGPATNLWSSWFKRQSGSNP